MADPTTSSNTASSSSVSLPIGWDDRNNQMSEKDRQLGGDAANKFAQPVVLSAYQSANNSSVYQTSEQVRQHYYQSLETTATSSVTAAAVVPAGWEDRARIRTAQAEHYNTAGTITSQEPPTSPDKPATTTAHVAVLRVTTHSLAALAEVLNTSNNTMIPIPATERAAFARAVQQAVTAMAQHTTDDDDA